MDASGLDLNGISLKSQYHLTSLCCRDRARGHRSYYVLDRLWYCRARLSRPGLSRTNTPAPSKDGIRIIRSPT